MSTTVSEINARFTAAGWRPILKDGDVVTFARALGEYVQIGGVDPQGAMHGGGRRNGKALADYLLEIGLPPAPVFEVIPEPEPEPAPEQAPAPLFTAATCGFQPFDYERMADMVEAKLRKVVAEFNTSDDPPAPVEPAPPAGVPKEFADLVVAGEAPEETRSRLFQRLTSLRHLAVDRGNALPPPTQEESVELQDLERRASQSKWLNPETT